MISYISRVPGNSREIGVPGPGFPGKTSAGHIPSLTYISTLTRHTDVQTKKEDRWTGKTRSGIDERLTNMNLKGETFLHKQHLYDTG